MFKVTLLPVPASRLFSRVKLRCVGTLCLRVQSPSSHRLVPLTLFSPLSKHVPCQPAGLPYRAKTAHRCGMSSALLCFTSRHSPNTPGPGLVLSGTQAPLMAQENISARGLGPGMSNWWEMTLQELEGEDSSFPGRTVVCKAAWEQPLAQSLLRFPVGNADSQARKPAITCKLPPPELAGATRPSLQPLGNPCIRAQMQMTSSPTFILFFFSTFILDSQKETYATMTHTFSLEKLFIYMLSDFFMKTPQQKTLEYTYFTWEVTPGNSSEEWVRWDRKLHMQCWWAGKPGQHAAQGRRSRDAPCWWEAPAILSWVRQRVPSKMDFPGCLCARLLRTGHPEQVPSSSKTQGSLVWYKVLWTQGQKIRRCR